MSKKKVIVICVANKNHKPACNPRAIKPLCNPFAFVNIVPKYRCTECYKIVKKYFKDGQWQRKKSAKFK